MDCTVFHIAVCLLLYFVPLRLCVDVDYIDTACDSASVSVTTSRQLDSDTGLSYAPSLSCFYHVVAPTGRQIMLFISRFDLEYQVNGSCVDFVDIHDGSDVNAAKLNTAQLCGTDAINMNFTSTGSDMTIYFKTDTRATGLGFQFLFVAFQTGSCETTDIACTNGLCIDESLKCNVHNDCGDKSDESNCVDMEPPGIRVYKYTNLIIGLSVGILFAILIGLVIAIYVWKQNRWRVFAKRPLTAKHFIHNETTFSEAYPVTKGYYKERYQQYYRTPERPEYIGDNERNLNRQMERDATVLSRGAGAINPAFDDNEKGGAESSSPTPEWKTWEKTGL